MTTTSFTPPDAEVRQAAITRLRKKRGLQAHLLAYVTVNLLLVGIWYASGVGFFWPLIPMLGWGIGGGFQCLGRLLARATVRGTHPERDAAPPPAHLTMATGQWAWCTN
jgi:hypothetical protein